MNIEKPRKIIMEEASADSPRSRVEAARSENASRRKALVEEVKRLKAETSDQGRAARVGATMKQFQTHVSDARSLPRPFASSALASRTMGGAHKCDFCVLTVAERVPSTWLGDRRSIGSPRARHSRRMRC